MAETDQANLENLGRDPVTGRFLNGHKFSPGTGGRPPGPSVVAALKAELAEAAALGRDPLRDAIRAVLTKAECGDLPATEFLTERLDGKVPQTIDLNHGPVELHWAHEQVPEEAADAVLAPEQETEA